MRAWFVRGDVQHSFAEAYFERGVAYRDERRVIDLRIDTVGRRVISAVAGSSGRVYRVDVSTLAPNGRVRLSGICSCPIGADCKHVVATLLAALDRLSEADSSHDAITKTQEMRDDDPTPIIRIFTQRVSNAERFERYFLSLRFAYGLEVIDVEDPREIIESSEPGRTTLYRRRNTFEQWSIERLQSFGLERLAMRDRSRAGVFAFVDDRDGTRLARFARHEAETLREDGWEIDYEDRSAPAILDYDAPVDAQLDEADDRWFDLDLGVVVEGTRVSLLPAVLDALVRLRRGQSLNDEPYYVRIDDGRFVAVPALRVGAVVTTLVDLFGELPEGRKPRLRLDLSQSLALARLSGVVRVSGVNELRAFADAIGRDLSEDELRVPEGLQASLRPYQQRGLGWLQRLARHGFGGILADDMGLGKTLQAIAHIARERERTRVRYASLIVAPTSVLPNWQAECARFVPGMRVVVWHGGRRATLKRELAGADIVVTSYALLLRDQEFFTSRRWHIAVLDEAQAIKNTRAKVTHAAYALRAEQRIALTGTPMENHLDELASIIMFIEPGLLGTPAQFMRHFRTPIEKHGNASRRALLAERIAPFLLRRTKAAVERELPPKTQTIVRIELRGGQRDLYESVRLAMHDRVRQEIAARGLMRSRIVVLDALLKLRQVCCDPALVKLPRAKDVHESAKREALLEMLPEFIEDGRRILIFSQFTSMLDILANDLRVREIPFVELRGSTRDRQAPVARFQAGEVPVFLISLRAGGVGLNLTAADTVIHYDPWWNPAVERQATDRAHRIGQHRSVFVYKFIAVGTVEERIVEMQERKDAIALALFDETPDATLALSAEGIETLFAPLP